MSLGLVYGEESQKLNIYQRLSCMLQSAWYYSQLTLAGDREILSTRMILGPSYAQGPQSRSPPVCNIFILHKVPCCLEWPIGAFRKNGWGPDYEDIHEKGPEFLETAMYRVVCSISHGTSKTRPRARRVLGGQVRSTWPKPQSGFPL